MKLNHLIKLLQDKQKEYKLPNDVEVIVETEEQSEDIINVHSSNQPYRIGTKLVNGFIVISTESL